MYLLSYFVHNDIMIPKLSGGDYMNCINDITLLIVDDEVEIRSGLRTVIPWESYSISVIGTASNGKEALEMICNYHPDIVISDIKMPEMSGLQLIKEVNDKGISCSFIILSGFDDFNYAKSAIKYGVKDYLLKPVVIQELLDIISRLTNDIISQRKMVKNQQATLETLKSVKISMRKTQLIRELIHSEINEVELTKIINNYSLPIQNKESCVVLFKVLPPKDSYEEEDSEIWIKLNYLKEKLEKRLYGYKAIISEHNDQKLLVILNLPFKDLAGESLSSFFEDYIRDMTEETSLRLFASIGENVNSLMDISHSYQTAGQALAWYIYDDIGPIINHSILQHPAPPVINFDNKILDAMLQNNVEKANEQLDIYLNKLRYIPAPPPNYIYSMCSYLIINLRNSLNQYMDTPPRGFSGDAYTTLQKLESFQAIHNWMKNTIHIFMTELQIRRIQQADPIIEKTIDYIQRNIFKKIRAEDICDYVGLSKSYFSTYFKNKTQLNFRDYILDLKITYAQEQLKSLENSPKELSIMLGYEDYRSFSRAFKTRTGFAPSDYQKKYVPDGR